MILAAVLMMTYLFGGIPVGFILAKYVRGIDLREFGSKTLEQPMLGE